MHLFFKIDIKLDFYCPFFGGPSMNKQNHEKLILKSYKWNFQCVLGEFIFDKGKRLISLAYFDLVPHLIKSLT